MPFFGNCEQVIISLAIAHLLTALGLSLASGLRAYLPLAAVFIGEGITDACSQQLISLSQPFQQFLQPFQSHLFGLNSAWILVALLAVLAGAEFVLDKVPIIDHASDLVHTVVRPVAGAVVMAGVSNPLSNWNPWVAAVTGAALALVVHGTKAATRTASTATTAGLANPIVSVIEDILAVLMIVLSLLAPFLAVLFFVLLALLFIRAVTHTARWARNRTPTPSMAGAGAPPPPPPPPSATYYGAPPDGPEGSSPPWPG